MLMLSSRVLGLGLKLMVNVSVRIMFKSRISVIMPMLSCQ